MDSQTQELLGLTAAELSAFLSDLGEKPFHGRQVYRALYGRCEFDLGRMTELSKPLRGKLQRHTRITFPHLDTTQVSVDGTQKYLLTLEDGQKIESVFIPEQHRNTLCISTQVGCPMGCKFCLTALLGFSRNLSAGEIVGQILYVLRDKGSKKAKPTNIVLMGQGEPLLNLDHVSKALVLMADPKGLAISPHRITLSTVGLVPKLRELAHSPVVPNLAISLSATTDETRGRLMPVNRRYPIADLLEACSQFPLGPRQRITFEYVLIDGVNDTDEDARRLVRLLSRVRAKVNLLPLNLGKDSGMQPSPPQRIQHFQQILISKGLAAYLRRPRGADIFAACGQLHRAQASLVSQVN